MEPLYRIEELSTTGWADWNEAEPSMTKDKCQELYNSLLSDGINPDDLRIKRVG